MRPPSAPSFLRKPTICTSTDRSVDRIVVTLDRIDDLVTGEYPARAAYHIQEDVKLRWRQFDLLIADEHFVRCDIYDEGTLGDDHLLFIDGFFCPV